MVQVLNEWATWQKRKPMIRIQKAFNQIEFIYDLLRALQFEGDRNTAVDLFAFIRIKYGNDEWVRAAGANNHNNTIRNCISCQYLCLFLNFFYFEITKIRIPFSSSYVPIDNFSLSLPRQSRIKVKIVALRKPTESGIIDCA